MKKLIAVLTSLLATAGEKMLNVIILKVIETTDGDTGTPLLIISGKRQLTAEESATELDLPEREGTSYRESWGRAPRQGGEKLSKFQVILEEGEIPGLKAKKLKKNKIQLRILPLALKAKKHPLFKQKVLEIKLGLLLFVDKNGEIVGVRPFSTRWKKRTGRSGGTFTQRQFVIRTDKSPEEMLEKLETAYPVEKPEKKEKKKKKQKASSDEAPF